MIGKDKSYIKSNEITEVKLKAFRSSFSKDILLCGESITDRQKVSQKCLDYLCDKFKIEKVKLTVLNNPQRKKANGKTLGFYTVGRNHITIYNLTATTQKTVSIKTFYDTLLHEFIHHYDYKVLKLENSLHTSGFYQRISDLKNKLQ